MNGLCAEWTALSVENKRKTNMELCDGNDCSTLINHVPYRYLCRAGFCCSSVDSSYIAYNLAKAITLINPPRKEIIDCRIGKISSRANDWKLSLKRARIMPALNQTWSAWRMPRLDSVIPRINRDIHTHTQTSETLNTRKRLFAARGNN